MSESERSYQDELSDEMKAGGCTEAWETLSAKRDSSDSRRGFLGHVAATLGLAVGGSTLAAETVSGRDGGDEAGVETSPVRGRKRGQLLKRANNSDDVAFAADVLGEKPGVEEVVEYEMDGEHGYAVVFGLLDDDSTTIKYFEADDETKVVGGTPVGDGVRTVDGDNHVVHDVGTAAVEDAVAGTDAESHVSTGKYETAELNRSLLVREFDGGNRFDLFVPIVRQDEVVDRVIIQGTGDLSTPDGVEVLSGGDGASTQGHVVCGPTGTICTNYCSVLCGTLAGLAGSACLATCSGTVVGIPISPACGAICTAVVAGVCVPTCTNLAH